MVADIVGYSRMIEADEAGTIAAIKKLRSDIIDPLLTEAHGRIVKLMGDGLIVEFGSVVDAVSAAVDMQNALAARQATSSPDRRIVFRIGINLGDVVVDGDDLIGDGVNVAARLEQICEPGGVLVSGTGFDQLQGKLAVPIGFVGEQRVKNIQRPIRIYRVGPGGSRMSWVRRISRRRRLRTATAVAVALAIALALAGAGLWLFGTGGSRLMANASIAVLPFENLGGDEATLRLANGLTEDIITDLARYRNVDVIARNSTAVYQGKPVDVRQVGQDLNVSYVLEGSVQRDEDRIRITAQLIDARTAGHLWSQRWDRMFADFFAVQAEISEQVAAQVVGWQGAISLAEHQTHRRTQPQDMTVYDTYLRGDEALSRFTKESVEESIPLFESVVKEAPQFAQGWTALGSAYEAMVDFGADSQIALPNALDAVRHAIELDPMDADAHALLGQLLGMQGDFKRSEAEFDIALGLNPGSADVMSAYITFAAVLGQPQRGAELADRAIRLNPRYPPGKTTPFSYAYLMVGRYEDALRVLERQSTENYNLYTWIFRSVCYAVLGRRDEAKAWVAKALEHYPDLTIEGLLGGPDWSEAERKLFSEAMRTAGFPVCAPTVDEAAYDMTTFLPECQRR